MTAKPSAGVTGPTAGPYFRLVFLTVVTLLAVLLAVEFCRSFSPDPTQAQQALAASCDTVWKAAFGAILGLIGGKIS